MYFLCTGLLSWFDGERAKWWWSILAEAIMKHRVFPGSRWDVLLGNIPRDRGWRTGLMRKQSSQLRMEITREVPQKCPIDEYWFDPVDEIFRLALFDLMSIYFWAASEDYLAWVLNKWISNPAESEVFIKGALRSFWGSNWLTEFYA